MIKRQLRKTKDSNPLSHWSEKQRLEAVTTYLMLGKWPLVAAATGIPLDTLKKWKQADWWKDSEEEIRRSSNIELGGKLTRIISKAASVVEDRLENGELIFNPVTKAFTDRKPVRMKEASEVLIKTIDRNLLIEKIQEKPQFKEEAILDRLKNIEQALIRGAKKRYVKDEDIIDVTPVVRSIVYTDNVGDELQSNSQSGGLTSGASAELVSTSDSTSGGSGSGSEVPDSMESDGEYGTTSGDAQFTDDGNPTLLVQDSFHG